MKATTWVGYILFELSYIIQFYDIVTLAVHTNDHDLHTHGNKVQRERKSFFRTEHEPLFLNIKLSFLKSKSTRSSRNVLSFFNIDLRSLLKPNNTSETGREGAVAQQYYFFE